MDDPYAALRDDVLNQVLNGPGASNAALRNAAANDAGLPSDLQPLVDKIHAHAYKVTDDEMVRAQRTYGDDTLFELIVSAALGASRKRLLAGLRALEDA